MRQTECWMTSMPDYPICEMDPEDVEKHRPLASASPQFCGAGDESRTRVLSLGS